MDKFIIGRIKLLACCITVLAFLEIFKSNANYVYKYYTFGIYPIVKSIQGAIANAVKFSYGEILVGTLIFLGIVLILWHMRKLNFLFKEKSYKEIYQKIICDALWSVNLLLIIIIFFQLLWGYNYHQPNLFTRLDLKHQTVDVKEFVTKIDPVIVELNTLRPLLDKSDDNVAISKKSVDELLQQAYIDYEHASQRYPFINKPASKPKAIATSILFSYNGISGIYNPFSGEANINHLNSQFMIPVVALHELSHQQGIAKEDEANFIAYIVANESDDNFTRYSGNLLLVIHGLNNLKNIDPISHKEMYEKLSEGVKKDLDAHRQLWAQFEGPLEDTHDWVNDTYLKANGQESGIKSYSEMIELYVAWALKNE